MKRISIWTLAIVAVAALTWALSPRVGAAISGSDHDFSGETWNSGGEICAVCHTPHNADTTVTDAPLWDHDVTAVSSYTLYSSTTLDATVGQPGGISKLCLSCHDGTVALDSFAGQTGTNFMPAGDANFGTDLSDHHPIGFTYDASLATTDGELFDPSTATTDLGGTISADLLFAGKLECASCHDVHNGGGFDPLLRIDNSGSNLCLTCHDK